MRVQVSPPQPLFMKISYAEYLKRESAVWALLDMLNALKVMPRRVTRFGPVRYFSDNQINSYITRLVEKPSDR